MKKAVYRRGLAFLCAALCALVVAPSAFAAEDPYEFEPVLSLTGNCAKPPPDLVEDPSCPGGPPSGRFKLPLAIAIDAYGFEYVASYGEFGVGGRVDVFNDEGKFVTELADTFGPKTLAVDKLGNLYVFEQVPGGEGEVARYSPTVYDPAGDKIEYGPREVIATLGTNNAGLAVDFSNDHLFVAAGISILEYGSAVEENKLLDTLTSDKLHSSTLVAVDAERRRLYASSCKNSISDCGVLVFDADSYTLLEEVWGEDTPAGRFISEKGWTSISVDEETGHFFVDDLEQTKNVYEFNEDYEYVSTLTFTTFQGGNVLQTAVSNSPLNPLARNRHYLFVPVQTTAGRAYAFAPPKEQAPEIVTVSVSNVAETEAELRATIDPSGGDTEYVFEYVSEDQFEASGFDNALVGKEGTIKKESGVTQVVSLLKGLLPGSSYRFRVVATNLKGSDEAEGEFTTYADAPIGNSSTCANALLRTGPSALLPDCRAYELVTPADTNGRPPKGIGFVEDGFATVQTSPSGTAVSFLTEGGPLPGMEGTGGFNGDPYLATRGPSGWSTASVGPSGVETDTPEPGGISSDQGFRFWKASGEGSAVEGQNTHYIRYPDGHSELIGKGSIGTDPGATGKFITEGGTHIIFQTVTRLPNRAQRLEPNSPPEGISAIYDRTSDGVTHLVSLLPGEVTPSKPEEHAQFLTASPDGVGIAFSILGTLYLRVDNAVTYELGKSLTVAGVSKGGRRIFYVRAGDLYAFDTAAEEEIPFAETGDATVVNVASDGSRAYFVSSTVIPDSGANPNGAFAQPGGENLYLSEEGTIRFVATVTERDVEGELNASNSVVDGLGLWSSALVAGTPAKDPSRLNPDGTVMLFQSRANLDGYDSGDFPQIFRYDSTGGRLHCISCIPTKSQASGGASLETYAVGQGESPPFGPFGFVPNLTPTGGRAFFQSREALVKADTDGLQDVYEWEEEGVGSCLRAGGCVYLVSSGHSIHDNYLYAVSGTGDDVFFVTDDVLVPGDDDTLSIYDARVGGGFPVNAEDECRGEGCRPGMTPSPPLSSPANPAAGDDNVGPKKPKKCPKGKRRVKRHGKVRCVKKHRGHHGKRAGTNGGAAK